jgi:hypothetical protein
MKVLDKPYTKQEILKNTKDYCLEGIVRVPMDVIIDNDFNFEGFLDFLSEQLIDSIMLQDISYELAGCDVEKQEIFLKVAGNPEDALDKEY